MTNSFLRFKLIYKRSITINYLLRKRKQYYFSFQDRKKKGEKKLREKKKIVCYAIAICFIFSIFQTTALAAKPADNETRKIQLEEQYHISITIPTWYSASEISIYLTALEHGLRNLTPNMVQQISDYYKSLTGEYLEIYFGDYNDYLGVVGLFEYQKGDISLFVMKENSSEEIEANFLHEFGHAFHYFCIDKLGKEKVLGDWELLNQGYQYVSWIYGIENLSDVFPSQYGMSDIYEDFAEVFMYLFDNDWIIWEENGKRTKPFYDNISTILYTKVDYIGSLIQQVITSPEVTLVEYNKDLKDRTSARNNNIGVPGDYQYGDYTINNWCIGYDMLQMQEGVIAITEYADGKEPSGVIAALANEYRKQGKEVTWVSEYGLWRVTEADGIIRYIAPEYPSSDTFLFTPNRTATGWSYDEIGWWYQKRDGSYITASWFEDRDGKWYYFDERGYMMTDATTPDGYWIGEDGVFRE